MGGLQWLVQQRFEALAVAGSSPHLFRFATGCGHIGSTYVYESAKRVHVRVRSEAGKGGTDMTWLLVIVWILGGGLFAFSFWIFGLAAMRMISGRHPRGAGTVRSLRRQAARFVLVSSRAPLWFPHGATGIEPVQPASEWRKTMTTTSDPTTTQLLDGTTRQSADRQPKWIAPVVIAALLVGGTGLGVRTYAVATTPAKSRVLWAKAGTTGATGAQGPRASREIQVAQGTPARLGLSAPPRSSRPLRSSRRPIPQSEPSSWPKPGVLPERSS